MQRMRWETDRRYYTLRIYRDLFGAWIIERVWGGKRNNLGSRAQEVVFSYPDAEKVLDRI